MLDPKKESDAEFVFTDSEALPWRASLFAHDVEVKDLGAANGRAMQLVRYRAGASFPIHKHKGPEFVYVLEGELIQGGRRLGPGWASVAATGTIDDGVRSDVGCLFLTVYAEEPGA